MSDPFQIAKLPAGLEEPGVYVTMVADGDPGLSAPNNKALIWGYMTPGYPGILDQPTEVSSQSQVDALYGPKSMIAQRYAAAKSQIPIGFQAVLVALAEPSSGTASAVKVEFTGEPVAGVLSAATAAAAADTVRISYRGRGCTVDLKKGDDWQAIATAVEAKWNQLYSPAAVVSRVGAELTFTAPHKGAYDNGALEVTFASNGASGVAAKLGTFTVSGAAGAAGSVLLKMGKHSATIAVGNGDAATVTGNAIVSTVNSSSYPVRLAQPSVATGVLTIFYVNGRPVRPLSISSTETSIAPQAVADSVGTAGVGVPTLTAALANLAAIDEAYKAWAPFWTSITELSALVTHIEAQVALPQSKGQMAVISSWLPYAQLASVDYATATTPRLDSSWRYPVLFAQCCPNADWELNVRLVAAIAAEGYVARNWNGFMFMGSDDAPCLPIHKSDRPSTDERNLAISTLRCAPVTVNKAGYMAMTWGGNTYKPRGFKDAKLRKISAQLTLDYYRSDLANYLESLFGASSPSGAKKIKTQGEPRTVYTTTPEAVQAAVYRWTERLDDNDLFDGAKARRDAIKAAIVVSPTRIDVNVPFVPPPDLDILAPVGIIE